MVRICLEGERVAAKVFYIEVPKHPACLSVAKRREGVRTGPTCRRPIIYQKHFVNVIPMGPAKDHW